MSDEIVGRDAQGGHLRLPGGWRERVTDVVVLAAPLVAGGISGLSTIDALRSWYPSLDKPAWNPPDWVFGPVWTALYAAMGVALVQVWRADRRRREVRVALALFAVQLGLNFGWSWIFFGLRALGPAFAEVLVLLLAIAATIGAFWRIRRPAALLLVPYLAWTGFATILNGTIWQLNR